MKKDNVHTLPLDDEERIRVTKAVKKLASKTDIPGFYEVKDVAARIAGTSSLGLKRYIVLVEGNGTPNGNYLLDIKETRPSCLANFVSIKQPTWACEAERIVEIESRFISDPPALLHNITIDARDFVMKELQPSADRIDYNIFANDLQKLKSVLVNMANIYAWSNLRTTGRQGSAIADEMIAFSKNSVVIKNKLKDYAFTYSRKTEAYYNDYCKAFNKGMFQLNTH